MTNSSKPFKPTKKYPNKYSKAAIELSTKKYPMISGLPIADDNMHNLIIHLIGPTYEVGSLQRYAAQKQTALCFIACLSEQDLIELNEIDYKEDTSEH